MRAPVHDPRVIVALDCPDAVSARALVQRLSPALCRLKVGKELFTAAGPQLIEALVQAGYDVFLDLKYHDIPNTVAQACRAAAALGVWMLDVHALGGRAMMEAARSAIAGTSQRPYLIAVTVLTSHDAADLAQIGIEGTPASAAERLAHLTAASGLDGVVCSAQEAPVLRRQHGAGFLLLTPGIRPAAGAADDQKRITTPADAVRNGADYLVVGRPVTKSSDPAATLAAINREIAAAAGDRATTEDL
jgi:orotidine-5'-phosphate decarboxylase